MTGKMKPSGITWIGDIPESWDIGRVKDYYTLQTGFTPDTSVSEYYDDENGYLWVSIADIDKEKIIYDTKSKISNLYVREKHPASSTEGSLLYSFKLSVGKVNTPSGMVPSGRSNGAHRTGKWCRLTAWMVHGHTASV